MHDVICLMPPILRPCAHAGTVSGAYSVKTSCSVIDCWTLQGVERHLRLRSHELLEYETKLQRVIGRYEKRLEWLRSGSRGVFGSILEEQIVLLLDTSGTMSPSIHQLKLGVAALIWEQLHGNNIK